VSRRSSTAFVLALIVAGLPASVVAQDQAGDVAPMWGTSVKNEARDVTAYSGGFAIVGGKDKKPTGQVWLSPDGSKWTRVQDDAFDGAIILRVTAFGDGLVALGTKGRKLVGWYSPDGDSWKKSTIDKAGKETELFPQAITDGPAGLIAVASLVAQDLAGQRFYSSTDGRAWKEIDPPADTAPGIFVSLESTDDGYLALARPMFGPSTDLIWSSPDGVTWEALASPDDGFLSDLAVAADGTLVGVGARSDTFTSAIWHQTDAGGWELVWEAPSGKDTEEYLDVVAVGGPGFLAGGSTSTCPDQPSRYCPSAAILASADGSEWQMLGVDDGVPGPLFGTSPIAMATSGGDTVVVVGHANRPVEAWTLPASE
jgi:hypothetical protein